MSFRQLIAAHKPIIQAPMAGGITTPELVSAVCKAGAIGSFGFAYSTAEAIHNALQETSRIKDAIINANFFVFNKVTPPQQSQAQQAITALEALSDAPNIDYELPQAPYFPSLSQQIEPVWYHKPQILTFHFGLPSQDIIDKAHHHHIYVGISATNLSDARAIEAAGADFVIAQGIEAGGHRGTFEPYPEKDEGLSTQDLTALLSQNLSIPIVSAGGIMCDKDIKIMLEAGALAVQIGTGFLCCDEAGTSADYRHYLLTKQDRPTVYTRGFSGRLAQSIETSFTKEMANQAILPFPLQNTLTGALRKQAVKSGNPEHQSLWAGQNFAKIKAQPVQDFITELMNYTHL